MKVEDARIPDAPPQIAFGEPVKAGRAIFTPQKLTIEPGREQGERKLVLTGLLENVTASSQAAIFGIPERPPELSSGGAKFPDPKVNLVRDNHYLKQLEPRIREAVTFVWKVPQDWREQDVSIEFNAQQFKLNDNLYAKASWLGHYPTGILKARPEKGT
ncbi:hypothetical protein [Manganibacter manganicus]|nr:hypothetical protein [Pseudaminobacter manganicus]